MLLAFGGGMGTLKADEGSDKLHYCHSDRKTGVKNSVRFVVCLCEWYLKVDTVPFWPSPSLWLLSDLGHSND